MKKIYLLFPFLFTSVYAQETQKKEINPIQSAPTENLKLTYCPPIEKIMHDPKTNLWGIEDWVSNEPSYEKKIVAFQAAQWVGANIGTMICVYKSDNPTSFPITLQNTTLVPAPTSANWGKYEQGRKNCPPFLPDNPIEVTECPFYMPQKIEKKENIYEQLDFFKNKKTGK